MSTAYTLLVEYGELYFFYQLGGGLPQLLISNELRHLSVAVYGSVSYRASDPAYSDAAHC